MHCHRNELNALSTKYRKGSRPSRTTSQTSSSKLSATDAASADQRAVPYLARRGHILEVGARIQPIENAEDLFGPFRVDDVDGALSRELRVAREQPHSDFIRRIIFAEPSDD